MIISANQPFFAPFPGFFFKAQLSDIFIILDTVQFPHGTTWTSRNRFKNDQGTMWITVPVMKKGLGLQRIKDVRICHKGNWKRKHLKSIKTAYANSPYLPEYIEEIENIFSFSFDKLVDLNLEIIKFLLKSLNIKTKLVLLSELNITEKGSRLLIEICKKLGSSDFLARYSARKYLDTELFKKEVIQLHYFDPPSPVYPQLWGDFISNLSTLDLIFNCGPKPYEILPPGKK